MTKSAPTPPSAPAPRWPWAFYALAAGLLLAGEAYIQRGSYTPGLMLAAVGILCGAAGFILPVLPWAEIRGQVAGAAGTLRAMRRNAGGLAGAGERLRALAPRGRGDLKAAAVPALPRWRLFPEDHISIPRFWLLAPVILFAVLMQMSLMGGSIVRACLMLAGLVLFLVVYLQDMARPILLPHANRNLLTLILCLGGVPFSLWGAVLLWQYKYVMTGWFLTTLGGALLLAPLFVRPLRLDDTTEVLTLGWHHSTKPWTQRASFKAMLVAGAAVCAYLARYIFGLDHLGQAFTASMVGIVLLLSSFPWFDHGLLDFEPVPQSLRAPLAVIMVAAGFLLGVRGQHFMDVNATTTGLWYFLAGAICFVVGLGHAPAEVRGPGERADGNPLASGQEPQWALRSEWIILGVFMLVVFAMRAWNVDLFPYGAEGDEAGGGVFAMDVLRGRVETIPVTENVPLYFYSITSLFFKYFGLSVGVMRWHVVIFGTLSVIALYFLLRQFFGRWVAFLAAMLMACAHWHLHYSRFGHYNAEQIFCQTVAFYFVFRSMRTGQLWYWFAGGVAFGLAILPALASRVLPFEGIALVLYFLVARRDLLRRHLNGFLIFVITSWMVASPCLVYWARVIPLSMGRVSSVSIFDKTNTNAPVDTLAGFVSNCKVNLLMFNEYGDSRSRNNPLPSQKMLDTWTAVLFALAFAYTLYHWRDSLNFFLMSAFFINLSASIFSVEAPQSHRTAGNIPIIFSMIAILLWDVRRAFTGLGRRIGPVVFALVMVPLFGFFSYHAAMRYFVDARRLSFDVAPTYVALRTGQVGTEKDLALFWATGFAASHPPVILFRKDVPVGNYFNIADYFPVSLEPGRRHLLFLVDDYQAYAPWVHAMYPNAKMEVIPNLLGGQDIATWFIVTAQDAASIQGLNATSIGGVPRSLTGVPLAWPVAGLEDARGARFSGSLSMHWFGLYTLAVSGKGDARIKLNGKTAFERNHGVSVAHEMRLPRGLSRIEAEFHPAGPNDAMQVSYVGMPHPAHQIYDLRTREEGMLTRNTLFGRSPQGLYGRYYLGRGVQGDPVMEYVEPSLLSHWLDSPITGAWSAEWRGKLKIPADGPYSFVLTNNGGTSDVMVAGKVVSRVGGIIPDGKAGPPPLVPSLTLRAGQVVPIRVRYSTTGPSWTDLHWTRPNGVTELIPPDALEPEF